MQFKDIQLWGNYSHIGEKKKDSGQSLSTMEVIPSQSFASTTNLLVKKKWLLQLKIKEQNLI